MGMSALPFYEIDLKRKICIRAVFPLMKVDIALASETFGAHSHVKLPIKTGPGEKPYFSGADG